MQPRKYLSIVAHYEWCLQTYGDQHLGVDWSSARDAETRYRVMLDVIRTSARRPVSLLDFGCGASHLLDFIFQRKIEGIAYTGLDLSSAFARLFTSGDWWAHVQTGQLMLVYKWLPGPFGFAMLLSFSTLVMVSLLTKPEDHARLEAFFDRMRRSTDRENLPTGQAKPLAAERGQELILLDAGTWFTAARWRGFLRRYREDLVGFLLAWAAVGLLILCAWLLMQIGK